MLPTFSDSRQSVYCNPLVKSKGKLYAFNIPCHRINITVPKERNWCLVGDTGLKQDQNPTRQTLKPVAL